MKRQFKGAASVGFGLAAIALTTTARAGTAIDIEAVDAYNADCGPLHNNISNIDNFRVRMLQVAGFTAGVRYTDPSVYRTDFVDPERPGGVGGGDAANFDRANSAIAYFSGHGICDDHTNTACYAVADCPAISGHQAVCLRDSEGPLFASGHCAYSMDRNLVVDRTGTQCEAVNYSSGPVAFGESPQYGPFAGAGTNGGVNVAVLDVSCGVTPGFWWEGTRNLHAGVSTIATIMPTTSLSDTFDTASRGRAWADRYVTNANSSISVMWADALNGTTGGNPCSLGGGSHGIDGCGANISISSDSGPNDALWANQYETWTQARDDANDAGGANYYSYVFTCNYDCNNHPFFL